MKPLSATNELVGTKFLSLLVVSGLFISGISIMFLENSLTRDSATSLIAQENGGTLIALCENGLCNSPATNSLPVGSVYQQSVGDLTSDAVTEKNTEVFTSLKILKNKDAKKYELADNKATLFAAKDSFLREGIKNTNEGSNQVLRVMGKGQTNNRALVAFDQSVVQEVLNDKTLESATLRLFVVSNDGKWEDGRAVNAHMLKTFWLEGIEVNAPLGSLIGTQKGATWNCSTEVSKCQGANWDGGNFVTEPTDSVVITNQISGQWLEFEVTTDVTSFVSGDSPNYGWIILKEDEDSSGRINIGARESSLNTPQLELTFS